MSMSLAEELVLIAVEVSAGRQPGRALDVAVLGAEVVDLALSERVEVSGGRAVVVQTAPTGDPQLDARLEALAAGRKLRPLQWHLERASGDLRKRYLARLQAASLVEQRPARVLGLFPVRRWWPTAAGAGAGVRRLDAVVRGLDAPEPRTVALAALVRAARLGRALYPGREGCGDRERLERVGRGEPVGEAVARAIAAIEAVDAAMVAVVAVASASTAQGGHGGGHG